MSTVTKPAQTAEDRMAATTTAPGSKSDGKKLPPRDPVREVIETVVFVVVLVLLLKLFVTEAFVIPTGSMAETLYGYQKLVTCEKCGHEFPVNSHDEVDGRDGRKFPLAGCTCPNCRFEIAFPMIPGTKPPVFDSPINRTGDRVLVLKPIYHVQSPERGDVVVFKFPKEPQQKHQAQNYIKRVQGFPGETIAIYRGELYVTRSLEYPPDERDEHGNVLFPRPDDPRDVWRGGDSASGGYDYRYPHNQKALELFEKSRKAGFPIGTGGFEQVRKTTDQVLACRRIVWDNDQQPRGLSVKSRWYDPAGTDTKSWVRWATDNVDRPRVFTHTGDDLDWARYRHLVWAGNPSNRQHWRWSDPQPPQPGPVDNFLAYNFGTTDPAFGADGNQRTAAMSWVGDLVLECEAETGTGAEVVLELSKGIRRYQARFASGKVTLTSTGPGAREFGSRPCSVTGPGKYGLRFANVDSRLRVWVNDRFIDFGTDADDFPIDAGAEEGADPQGGWTEANDVAAPAGIGAKGPVTVRKLKLFRDIYYTRTNTDLNPTTPDVYYVQPDHYLCLGDNSASSSDSRSWGLVPARLMLGKAVFVFWPVGRVGFIK